MTRVSTTALIICTSLLLVMAAYAHLLTGDYGDKGWEMLYAHMWLDGARMHRDIFPVSPPLIFWIYALPAALSHHIQALNDFELLGIMGLTLAGVSVALCTRLIALSPAFAGKRQQQMQFACMLVFLLVIRTNPHYFLDREHLFLTLIMPYLIRFLPSLRASHLSRTLSLLTGCLAGVGFCLKPHCVVVLLGIELLYLFSEKSPRIFWRLESCAVYGVGLMYLLIIAVSDPQYITTVVPMLLATYSADRDDTPIWDYGANATAVLVFTFLAFRPRDSSPYRRDIYYLLALCVPFFLYALVNNNWAYTYYPLGSIALLITAFALWEFLWLREQNPAARLRLSIGAVLCGAVFAFKAALSALYLHSILTHGCYYSQCGGQEPLTSELQEEGRTLSFGTISIDFVRWTNVVRDCGAEWKTRFPQLWMLPQFFLKGPDFAREHEWIRDYVGNAYAHDLNDKKPEVMFVDDTNVFYTARRDVDLVAFLSAVPAFAQAWEHYRFANSIDLCAPAGMPDPKLRINCKYDVYRRVK